MNLRPYQMQAVDACTSALQAHRSALLVLPTGTGKTVVFSHLAERQAGRTLILAHRQELVEQAAEKIQSVTGTPASIEMGDRYSNEQSAWGPARVVVASVQTMVSGFSGQRRMHRFCPDEFSLVVIDEAHHASAASYRSVVNYFTRWPHVQVLGVTATPDRADKQGLGAVFNKVAFQYGVLDAINDGWLVPVHQRLVQVRSLDFSEVRTRGGDFVDADLAKVMQYEKVLHGVVSPAQELTAGKRTLVFSASVDHARRMAEMWNRYEPGCARSIDGSIPKDERRQMLTAYARGDFRVLTSCMVLTEGWDCPNVEAIVMARPTKSRALYAQMLGRGTRPLPGLVDGVDDPSARCDAIAASCKPDVRVIDFTGNATKHKLVCAIDVLHGDADEEVKEIARRKATKGRPVQDAMDEAEQEILDKREAARREQEARRAALRAKAQYMTTDINPFGAAGMVAPREVAMDRGRQISDGMRKVLISGGVNPETLTFTAAKKLCSDIVRRWKGGICSLKQAHYLHGMGYTPDQTRVMTKAQANQILTAKWGRGRSVA
jgi:superfamily II DNA or RNA helicase